MEAGDRMISRAESTNEHAETLAGSGGAQPRHGLMDVLLPATPPRPRNARVVRLFDGESERSVPHMVTTPIVQMPAEPKPSSREAARAARAARNQSLLTAAGLE